MEKIDQLWPDGWQFLFDDQLFQPGTDSFLLGAFPKLKRGEHVCDLGAGTGLLGLLLLAREPSLHITNVEIQPTACNLARRTASLNGLESAISCIEGDLRDAALLKPGSFDAVIANPPYFAEGTGAQAENAARRTARSEVSCTLTDICTAAKRLLRWGGRLFLCLRPERMAELMALCRHHGLEPKRLRLVQNTACSAPSLLLLECRRGGKTGLIIDPPLLMTNQDGSPSAELDAVYFRDKR